MSRLLAQPSEVSRALADMPAWSRAGFAAACAERLLEVYRLFAKRTRTGEPDTLASALEIVWDYVIKRERPSSREIESGSAQCARLTPDLEKETSPLVSGALNAVNAVGAALDCIRSGTTDPCAEASTLVTDTIYLALGHVVAEGDPQLWQRTDAHPLIARELARQNSDLRPLQAGDVSGLRDQARTEAPRLARALERLLFAG